MKTPNHFLTLLLVIATGFGANPAPAQSPGTVVAWGFNSYGETTVPAGLTGVVAIAAGGSFGRGHTVVLKNDGTVAAWGFNNLGQTMVPAGLSGVIAIAAGRQHTVALRKDGTVVAWGDNSSGQTTVPARLSRVIAIAAGGQHTVALLGAGLDERRSGNELILSWPTNAVGFMLQSTIPFTRSIQHQRLAPLVQEKCRRFRLSSSSNR